MKKHITSPDPFNHTHLEWWFYWQFVQPFNRSFSHGVKNIVKNIRFIPLHLQVAWGYYKSGDKKTHITDTELKVAGKELMSVALTLRKVALERNLTSISFVDGVVEILVENTTNVDGHIETTVRLKVI